MWEKVVLNLLSNAFKFTFVGEIAVSLRREGTAVELRVRDTGTGIPAEELPRLFERFHRVENARGRTHEGSGIGLALVQELIKLHGGAVSMESAVGKGTTFTVALPLGSAHLPPDQIGTDRTVSSTQAVAIPYLEEALRWLPDDVREVKTSRFPFHDAPFLVPVSPIAEGQDNRPSVLVADDNSDMRQYLGRLLGDRYRVRAVADGEAALAAVRAQPPDLVLTDVMMPKIDGFGLLKVLREDAGTRSLPVIMLSARAGEESRVEGLEAGADDYLVKPFSARELLARIGAHLQMAQLRRDNEQQVRSILAAELETMTRLHALSSRLLASDNLTAALDDLLENAILTCGADFGNIQLYNLQSQALEIVAQRGFEADFLHHFRKVRVDEGSACAQAMQRGGRIVIEDVKADPTYTPHLLIAAAAGYQAVQSTPLTNRNGTVVGMLSTHFRAPHRLSQRDERLLDLYARHAADLVDRFRYEQALKDADRRKDEFLATLAHELRNPLAPLRNGLQLMHTASGDANLVDQARMMMDRQLTQLVRLVDDLMDVSRISRGKIELRREKIDLAAAVNSAIEASTPLIEDMAHTLTVTLPARPAVVDADLTRLAQVFLNLLNNAAKYTDRGGRISLTAERHGSDAVVSVRDTGIGIPAANLATLFEMFSQVESSLSRSQGGLGIGLCLVKSLVEMHGGRIEARSDGPGLGSEFVVRLPMVVEAGQPDLSERNAGDVARSSLRILIVDDNRDGADSLSMMLKIMGNTTRTAYDGFAALAAAEEFRPDVILLDIGLPRLNGCETCRRIRQQPSGDSMIIIAQTGWGHDEDRQRTHDAGFDHHMVKPVDPQALMKLLAGLSVAKECS
jgi:signal transduction histidine kinase